MEGQDGHRQEGEGGEQGHIGCKVAKNYSAQSAEIFSPLAILVRKRSESGQKDLSLHFNCKSPLAINIVANTGYSVSDQLSRRFRTWIHNFRTERCINFRTSLGESPSLLQSYSPFKRR